MEPPPYGCIHYDADADEPTIWISQFIAKHLEHLSLEQRDTLVNNILNTKPFHQLGLHSVRPKACAIGSLGTGLEHLSCEQKALLVEATLKMKERELAEAIGGLTEINRSQDRDIEDAELNAFLEAANGRTYGLGAGLGYLSDEQKASIVDATLKIRSPAFRAAAMAIGGLGAGLERLSDGQKKSLVDKAISDRKTRALHGLLAGFRDLSNTQQVSLMDAVLSILSNNRNILAMDEVEGFRKATHESACIIEKLGHCLRYLSETQKDLLVNSALDLMDSIGCYAHHANPIEGLGAGLQYLPENQKESLVNATLEYMESPLPGYVGWAGERINGLGMGLQYLDPKQQASLVEAALRLLPDDWDNTKDTVIASFGTGLQHLADNQKSSLVDAAVKERLPVAIGGLGRGLQYLSLEQRTSLLNALARLSQDDACLASCGLVEGLVKLAKAKS